MGRTSPGMPTFNGEALRRLRGSRGLSQQELADEVDLSLATINALENKTRTATPLVLRSLAKFFDVPRETFINGDPTHARLREPPSVDNKEWFLVGLHSPRKHDRFEATTLQEGLETLLANAGLPHQVFVIRLIRDRSVTIQVQITIRAIHVILNYFSISHPSLKQIDVILISKGLADVMSQAAYIKSLSDYPCGPQGDDRKLKM